MNNLSVIIAIFLIVFSGCTLAMCYQGISHESIGQEQQYGSTIEIIAKKERSDGIYFIVDGFLDIDNHSRAFLYRDRESRDYLIFADSFRVNVEVNEKVQELAGKYVTIEAVYYKEGFHPMFAGRFADVVRICPKMSLAEFNATRLK